MIDIISIRSALGVNPGITENTGKFLVSEYFHLLILNYLYDTFFINKLSLIGGANLRIIQGIDRFTEDLDFDCKNMSKDDFVEMVRSIASFFEREGIEVKYKIDDKDSLKANKCKLIFPEVCKDLRIVPKKNSFFQLNIEVQDQMIPYEQELVIVEKCGFGFIVQTPPLNILCAMKLSSLFNRLRGNDFYDVMFLLERVAPNTDFLVRRSKVGTYEEFKNMLLEKIESIDLSNPQKYSGRFLFDKMKAKDIGHFNAFLKRFFCK